MGDGFKIGHSFSVDKYITDYPKYDEDWYNSIIKYEIAPLLEEYWFDSLKTAREEIDKLIN